MQPNQNPEQIARDAIDAQLRAYVVEGQAVREYTTDSGHADSASAKLRYI